MKRTSMGALFVAPIIMAGSLLGAAHADQRQVIALQLDSICVDASSHQAIYALQNKNDFDIQVSYKNLDTGATGTVTVPANSFHGDVDPVNNPGLIPGYSVDYNPANGNNTTQFTAEGWSSPATTNAHVDVACTPSQLPVATTGGDNGSGSGTGSDNGSGDNSGSTAGSTNSNDNSGDNNVGTGADTAAVASTTPAVADTSATLADTGASQILPLAAAALMAVAILGTTVAVRKNIL